MNPNRLNDHSHNSGKYHKKDGTARRAILRGFTRSEMLEAIEFKPRSHRDDNP